MVGQKKSEKGGNSLCARHLNAVFVGYETVGLYSSHLRRDGALEWLHEHGQRGPSFFYSITD